MNRTVFSNWNQRVHDIGIIKVMLLTMAPYSGLSQFPNQFKEDKNLNLNFLLIKDLRAVMGTHKNDSGNFM